MFDATFEEFYNHLMSQRYLSMFHDMDADAQNIGNLPFCDDLKKKLCFFVYNVLYNPTYDSWNGAGCVLIGCPDRILLDIISTLKCDSNLSKSKVIDFKTMSFENEGAFCAELTNISCYDLVVFKNIKNIKSSLTRIFNSAIENNKINITVGKGPAARSIDIDLDLRYFVIAVDHKSEIPVGFFEKVHTVIDFTEYKEEIRRATALNTFEQYYLTATEEVLYQLSRLNVSEQDFTMRLFELRNMACEANVTEITESMLLGSKKSLPEIDVVNQMDGREFELFTGDLFRALGYTNVSVTPASGDFGADVIAEKDDVKFAIQCKRYSAPVGVAAVQEVLASKSLHDCHVACILTNNAFTPAAEALAKKNLVILWGGDKLQEFINRAKA